MGVVSATCRERRHTARSREALFRSLGGRASRSGVLRWSGEQQPETTEEVVRVWVDGLQRRREEVVQSERRASVTVVDGSRWWMIDPERGLLRHEGDKSHSVGTYDVASFLDPSFLIPHLDFGEVTSGEVDGRACWVVDAVPRRLADAVRRARADGHSWASIGAMLGTSGEAARQKFGEKTPRHGRR